MKKGILIAYVVLLLVALIWSMFLEVHASGCDDMCVQCTHYKNYEWTEEDIGVAVGIHAWSDIYYSWYEEEQWHFRRLTGLDAYEDHLYFGNFRTYQVMYPSYSNTHYISEYSGWYRTYVQNPNPPPPGQNYMVQDWTPYTEYFTQFCWAEGDAWFHTPDGEDDWYCYAYCYVTRW